MVKARVRVEGLARVTSKLKALDETAPAQVKALNREAAERVRPVASSLAPHREGALSSSIRSGATQRSGYVAAGSRAVLYAGPVHFGWPARNIAPQPFLWAAAEQEEPRIVDEYERGISSLITKVGL